MSTSACPKYRVDKLDLEWYPKAISSVGIREVPNLTLGWPPSEVALSPTSWYHLYMDERYLAAVAALRDTMAEYDETGQTVAASAAEIFVKELDKEDGFLQGVDREQATKVLFVLTTALVLVRDQMIQDSEHLLEIAEEDEGICEEEDCTYTHEDVDSDSVLAIIDGFEAAIAGAVGTTLTLADLAETTDPSEFDWTSDGTR